MCLVQRVLHEIGSKDDVLEDARGQKLVSQKERAPQQSEGTSRGQSLPS